MGKEKTQEIEIVSAYGFSQAETEAIRACLPADGVQLQIAEDGTDVLVNEKIAVLVRMDAVPEDQWQMLNAFYEDVASFSEAVIFVGDVHGKKIYNRITVYAGVEELLRNFKYILLAAQKRRKNAESFSRSVSYALRILKEITENPGISSRELSERLEISQRSVTRYIETLNMSGESIVYSRKENGWRLQYDESLLKL